MLHLCCCVVVTMCLVSLVKHTRARSGTVRDTSLASFECRSCVCLLAIHFSTLTVRWTCLWAARPTHGQLERQPDIEAIDILVSRVMLCTAGAGPLVLVDAASLSIGGLPSGRVFIAWWRALLYYNDGCFASLKC